MKQVLEFLDSIEGAGYGGMASYEIAKMTIRQTLWKCMGRKQSLPEPGECNWPDCGCDPHATKVIESLLEQGWKAP